MVVSTAAILLLLLFALSAEYSSATTSDESFGSYARPRTAAVALSRWRRGAGYPCNRKTAQLSCIIGCYGCAKTYGRYVYDMGACCRQCQLTQAEIIDVGPEQCSAEFLIAPGERKLKQH